MNADVLRMAGSFAGHDRTQTQTQAPVSLLPPEETGAGMGAKPTEAEVGREDHAWRRAEQRRQTRAHIDPRIGVRSQIARTQLAVPG